MALVSDLSGYLVSLRTKDDGEVLAISRSVSTGKDFSEKDWKKVKNYAKWILEVRERALLSTFFNEHYRAEHHWLTSPINATEILGDYARWRCKHFTDLEMDCILTKEDDLLEYLLMFAPDKSIEGVKYYGFTKRGVDE